MFGVRHGERHLSHRTGWLRAAVLGANDGIVSTAAIIVGVAAADSTRAAILTAGVAGLVYGRRGRTADRGHPLAIVDEDTGDNGSYRGRPGADRMGGSPSGRRATGTRHGSRRRLGDRRDGADDGYRPRGRDSCLS